MFLIPPGSPQLRLKYLLAPHPTFVAKVLEVLASLAKVDDIRKLKNKRAVALAGSKTGESGRKKGSFDQVNYNGVIGMYKTGATWDDIQEQFDISRSTISAYLRRYKEKLA